MTCRSSSGTKARAGVTGHHVRYVLALGLAGSIIAFVVIGLYFYYDFYYGKLTQAISQASTRIDPTTLLRHSDRARGSRDRASAWPVEHDAARQPEHQPDVDALAGRAAIHRTLPRHVLASPSLAMSVLKPRSKSAYGTSVTFTRRGSMSGSEPFSDISA
jgi:hypothetical protein